MFSIEVKVMNELGLHARPISKLTKFATSYEGKILLIKDGKSFNAQDMLDLIILNAKHGDVLELQIDGAKEESTANELAQLFKTKFGEA